MVRGNSPSPAFMSQARVLALLDELLVGFSSKSFQNKLGKLSKVPTESVSKDGLVSLDGRAQLALTVQQEVLPRYGLTGDEQGVLEMKSAVRGFMDDPLVAEKSKAIREKLLLPQLPIAESAPTIPASDEPIAAPKRPVRERVVTLTVQDASTNSEIPLTIRCAGVATVANVKAALIEQRYAEAPELVVRTGDAFGTRSDSEKITTRRVLVAGLQSAA